MYTETTNDMGDIMFYLWAYLTLTTLLVTAGTALYKVTYPPCTSRRCTHHTN